MNTLDPEQPQTALAQARTTSSRLAAVDRFAVRGLGIVCFFDLNYRSFLQLDGAIPEPPPRFHFDALYSKGLPWGS